MCKASWYLYMWKRGRRLPTQYVNRPVHYRVIPFSTLELHACINFQTCFLLSSSLLQVRIARGSRVDIRLPSVSSAILSSKSEATSMRDKDGSTIATGDSTFDLGEEGDEGAYCSLLQHDMTRHHHYDSSPYHHCDVGGADGDQLVTCTLL